MIAKVLFVIITFAAVGIVGLVLVQQSKGDAGSAFGGGGGGGSQSLFGSRGSANFLSRLTSILVTVFFAASIGLAYFYTHRNGVGYDAVQQEGSVLDSLESLDSEVPTVPEEAVQGDESTQTEVPEVPTLDSNVEESVPAVPTVPENK